MANVIVMLAALTNVLRSAFFAGGVVLAAVAAGDWAARTRRISPFGGVARFMRSNVDPRLASVERQVVRAGGHPTATPWWALVVYVIFATLVLAAVGMISGLLRDVWIAGSQGSGGMLLLAVHWTFRFLSFALIVRVVASWIPRFAGSAWVRWSYPSTEWMLRPLRRLIPTLGMMDITPILAYFALQIVESLVTSVIFRGL